MQIIPGEGGVENHLSIIITKGSSIFSKHSEQTGIPRSFYLVFNWYRPVRTSESPTIDCAGTWQCTFDCAGNIRTRKILQRPLQSWIQSENLLVQTCLSRQTTPISILFAKLKVKGTQCTLWTDHWSEEFIRNDLLHKGHIWFIPYSSVSRFNDAHLQFDNTPKSKLVIEFINQKYCFT